MSDRAYFQYFGDITKFGMNALMQLVSIQFQKNCTDIHINISSKGGCNLSALTAYNFLRNAPCNITTHNIGYCDSAANILFLSGKERKASPYSRFVVHSSKTSFPKDTPTTSLELMELSKGLNYDEEMFSNIFNEVIGIEYQMVRNWMYTGHVFCPTEAQSVGMISAIENFVPALGAEIIFINTEPPK